MKISILIQYHQTAVQLGDVMSCSQLSFMSINVSNEFCRILTVQYNYVIIVIMVMLLMITK